MKLLEKRSFVRIGFWAATVVLALMGWSLYQTTVSARDLTKIMQHHGDILEQTSAMSVAINRVYMAERAMELSPAKRFSQERDAAIDEARQSLGRAKALTANDPAQSERLRELAALLWEEEKWRPGIDGTSRRVDQAGEKRDARIAALTAEVSGTEVSARRLRRRERDSLYEFVFVILAAAAVVLVTLLVPAYTAYVRQGRARDVAESKLRNLTENLPGTIFQYRTFPDGRGQYEFLAGELVGLRGVKREAALADPDAMFDTVVESDRAGLRDAIRLAEENGTSVEHDYRIVNAEGENRWLRTSATQQRQPDGSILWSGMWRDVTERINMTRALVESKELAESANRAKTNFVTTMSHEIRTPMNGVLGMLELLGRTDLNAEQREMLQVVRDSGNSLQRIINDILDFSKIEAGKLELNSEPTSIARLVDSVYTVFSWVAEDKGLSFTKTTDARISPVLIADALRLRQVLGNLVSNAIKFTPKGRVEIRADLVDREPGKSIIRFTVRDSGIGMTPAAREQLFRPFVQAGAETAHRYGGTGLGLAISQRLVTLMGGSIGATSEAGVGTTMAVTIPFSVADPALLAKLDGAQATGHDPVRQRVAPSVSAAQADRTLILLADDHPTNRLVLLRQVNLLGYAAEVAEDGVEALDKWRSGRFALVITDCEMPRMNGYELARHIRAAEAAQGLARIAIVACTAYTVMGETEKCIAAGMDDYLSKPVDLKRLGEKIERWLPPAPLGDSPAEPELTPSLA